MIHKILLFTFFVLLFSCVTNEICDDNPNSELIVRFKHTVDLSTVDTIISGVSLYGIREGKSDSLLYSSDSTSRVVLPLDPHHSYSRFVMSINEESDTLYIGHNTGFYLMSYTCGYAAIFTLDPDSILHGNKLFYDWEIRDGVIDAYSEQDDEHLWLYF